MKFSLYLIPKLSPRIKLPRASTFLPSIMYLLCVAERFGKMFFHAFPASHGHYRCADVKATCPLCIKQNVKLEKKATNSPCRMAQGKDMYRGLLYSAQNIVKKDPGRARQSSLATEGTNFTKPGAQNKEDLCTS